jgi:hypothetical protein
MRKGKDEEAFHEEKCFVAKNRIESEESNLIFLYSLNKSVRMSKSDGKVLENYAKDEMVGLSLIQFKKVFGLENETQINTWSKLATELKKQKDVWADIESRILIDDIELWKSERKAGEDETPKEVKKKREKTAKKTSKESVGAGAGAGAGEGAGAGASAGETTMTNSQMEKFVKEMFNDFYAVSPDAMPLPSQSSLSSLSSTGSKFYNLSEEVSSYMSDASFAQLTGLEELVLSSPLGKNVLSAIKAISPNRTKKDQLMDAFEWIENIRANTSRKLDFTSEEPSASTTPIIGIRGLLDASASREGRSKRSLSVGSGISHAGAGAMSGGASVSKEQEAQTVQPVNEMPPDGMMQGVAQMVVELLNAQEAAQQSVPPIATSKPGDEKEDAVGQATTESTRQNELASNETATLEYKPNFTEVMDPANMRLATDTSRGNLGAGTSAQMQSADVWGNQFTQPPSDLPTQPELFLQTQPGGATVESSEDDAKKEDVYSFLPFAKLGGVIVWIPRHVQTAKFFFTSDDYTELTSHVRDGDPLTLDKTEEVDSTVMMSSIIKSYGTLKSFCQLGPMLPMSASVEQIYAEWLEMRQIGMAVGRYQQISGGMYENAELSMKGGIRSAVASALRPFVAAWNQMHTDAKDQIATDMPSGKPGMGTMSGSKRKAEAGLVEPEEYNPQFSYQPVDLKRVKFSIPTV